MRVVVEAVDELAPGEQVHLEPADRPDRGGVGRTDVAGQRQHEPAHTHLPHPGQPH
jgi:hypothetical protein